MVPQDIIQFLKNLTGVFRFAIERWKLINRWR